MLQLAESTECYTLLATVHGGLGLSAGIASYLHFFLYGNSEAIPTIFGAGVFVSVAYLLSAMASTLNRSHGSSRKSLVMFDAIMTAVSLVLSFVSCENIPRIQLTSRQNN